LISALLLIKPGFMTDIPGVILVGAFLALHIFRVKKKDAAKSSVLVKEM
jgi:UPF0716 family protein affecting phage T7 exclusion